MPTSIECSFVRRVSPMYKMLSTAPACQQAGAALRRLSQRELAKPGRRDPIAALAELGVAAAVTHDPADLLALDIAVDAGHPRVDLGEQQALARRNDVVGPGDCTRRSGLDAGQVAVACETDQTGHPIGGVLDSAREVAEPSVRAHHHQQVGKAVNQDAEKGLRPVLPLLFERRGVHPTDVDAVKGAGDRVETGCVDYDVEFVLGLAGLDAGRRYARDRGLVDVDELDIGLVVDLEIAALERDATGAKAVVLRD